MPALERTGKIILRIDDIPKYAGTRKELKADLIKLDIIDALENKLKDYGSLKPLHGIASANYTENYFEIPDVIFLKIIADPETITVEYKYFKAGLDLESIIHNVI